MGENEQGGMLRTVVVLGLISIIVGAVLSIIIAQKKAMVQRTSEITSTSQMQVGGSNSNDASSKTNGKTTTPASTAIDADQTNLNYEFSDHDDTASVTGLKDEDEEVTNVTIPDRVTKNGKTYKVTSIGTNAFYSIELTSLTLPDGLVSIGAYAFCYNQLTSVDIPNSVTWIGKYAFCYNKLTSVNLGTNTAVDRSAFDSNVKINRV